MCSTSAGLGLGIRPENAFHMLMGISFSHQPLSEDLNLVLSEEGSGGETPKAATMRAL